jgi:hypothetical protein
MGIAAILRAAVLWAFGERSKRRRGNTSKSEIEFVSVMFVLVTLMAHSPIFWLPVAESVLEYLSVLGSCSSWYSCRFGHCRNETLTRS